ncbi:MAG TPA: hypothetical protein VFL16_09570 [Steroidobacteraceae bacterium]|jgi:hypothetical protein|nr:hypothetical protein [Steroidobacteraceae bacterium]
MNRKVWMFRVLIIAGIIGLCAWTRSAIPSLAIAIAWGPNGLFLAAFMRGALRLPAFLEPVHRIEPVLYRWLGVGLVKRMVATPLWPMIHGFEPPPKLKNRLESLDRTEQMMRGAEICHGASLVLASAVALLYLANGRNTVAAWILVFNLLLNGYPVMLQRANRWRIQRLRAGECEVAENASSSSAS